VISPDYVDPDAPFQPIGECVSCDEPSEVLHHCTDCGSVICPACVCCESEDINRKLCEECPGASIFI